jgi:curved DNA-binding protein CbpA
LGFMTIQRSFEILELEPDATLDDARQAYKDIANVWHPDRFSANPRLKHKAEQKLKQVNIAYETAKAFFQQGELSKSELKGKTHNASRESRRGNYRQTEQTDNIRSRTEIAAEVGTALVLSFCSYVSAKLHHFVEKDRPQ